MIPKNIIYTYKNINLIESYNFPPMYQENIYLCKRFNNDFNYMFFSDVDIHIFICEKFPEYKLFFDNLPNIIMKTDFFRLLAVYYYGGFYFDMDVRITKNLDELLENEYIFPLEWNMEIDHFEERHRITFNPQIHDTYQLGNYAFASIKRGKFLLNIVENIIKRYKKKENYSDYDVLYYTGPDILNFTFWAYKDEFSIKLLEGCENEPYKIREWGDNKWHKFGSYGEHLLGHSWTTSDTDYTLIYDNGKSNQNKNEILGKRENDKKWLNFIDLTYPYIKNVKQTIKKYTDNYAVIIEPRKHQNLEYVIKNIMYFLNETWGMQIFCGIDNFDYVKNICNDYPNIIITKLLIKNMTIWDYSYLKKSVTFWERVLGKKQLFFQTDSILRKKGINEFLKYDLIGAPWKWDLSNKVGNSGICIMDKEKSKNICEKYYKDNSVDDIFFANNFIKEGYNVANVEEAKKFSVETIYYHDPMAIHKAWYWLNEQQTDNLLNFKYLLPC